MVPGAGQHIQYYDYTVYGLAAKWRTCAQSDIQTDKLVSRLPLNKRLIIYDLDPLETLFNFLNPSVVSHEQSLHSPRELMFES